MPRKPSKKYIDPRNKNEAAVALGRLGGLAKSGHRLNAEAVRYIRRSQKSAKELADAYEVHLSTIYQIRSRRTWNWVAG